MAPVGPHHILQQGSGRGSSPHLLPLTVFDFVIYIEIEKKLHDAWFYLPHCHVEHREAAGVFMVVDVGAGFGEEADVWHGASPTAKSFAVIVDHRV